MPAVIWAPTMVTLLRTPTDPKDILTSAQSLFTPPGSSSQGHVELSPCSSPPHGDRCQGIQYHVTQRRLCQHWLGFAFLWFCSSIVLQIACPEWDDCVCVPCASKAEEEMSPHLFKTMQRFAWKHCKSWKLFSCILNNKSGMAATLHGQVWVLALCQYHVRMRCEHGPASLLRLGF